MKTLVKWNGSKLYVSAKLAQTLKEDNLEKFSVLSEFTSTPRRGHMNGMEKLGSNVRELLGTCEVYRPNQEALGLAQKYLRLESKELLPETTEILIDELAFLVEHSSLLMKGKASIRLFKKGGIAILEG